MPFPGAVSWLGRCHGSGDEDGEDDEGVPLSCLHCGADCERKHWPKHKRSCKAAVAALARHAHRERLARAVREKGKAKVQSTEDDDLCVICQAKPVDPVEVSPNIT